MSLFQNNAGFNITKSKLQLIEVNYTEDDFFLENVDEEYFSDFIDSSVKETKFISVLQSAFNSLALRYPLKSDIVSFTLPYDFFKIISLPFDKTLIDTDLKEFIEWEFSVLYPHCNHSDYLIRFVKIDESGLLNKNRILIFALEKRIVKALHKFALKNNLTVKLVDNVHVAGNLIIFANPEFNKLQNSISLYLTEESGHFLVLEGVNPILVHSFNYTNISELIPAILEGINLINQTNIDPRLLHKAYVLTDSVNDNIITQIRQETKVNFLRVNPFDKIMQSEHIKSNEMTQKKLLNFSSALGIVLRLE